ncbi:hypothetical protein JCM6882_008026 [Rhodosporidiobolus microsporus]
MPTITTKNTGGTPHTRAAALVGAALESLDPSHPSYKPLSEAYALVAGEEAYMERYTSDLLVPHGHGVAEDLVRAAWDELLKITEETDWKQVKADGKTQYELGAGMCSGAYEAVVLQNIALLAGSTSALEIGVFTGTATLALGLIPSVQHITALDIEPFLKEFVAPYWKRAGVADKINFEAAPAIDTLKKLKEQGHGGFDLVFIDADKPSYGNYVRAILELGLLQEGGVILADNTLYKGYAWAPPGSFGLRSPTSHTFKEANGTNNKSDSEATTGIDTFNAYVRDHPDLETCVLPVRDGITVIRRKA